MHRRKLGLINAASRTPPYRSKIVSSTRQGQRHAGRGNVVKVTPPRGRVADTWWQEKKARALPSYEDSPTASLEREHAATEGGLKRARCSQRPPQRRCLAAIPARQEDGRLLTRSSELRWKRERTAKYTRALRGVVATQKAGSIAADPSFGLRLQIEHSDGQAAGLRRAAGPRTRAQAVRSTSRARRAGSR